MRIAVGFLVSYLVYHVALYSLWTWRLSASCLRLLFSSQLLHEAPFYCICPSLTLLSVFHSTHPPMSRLHLCLSAVVCAEGYRGRGGQAGRPADESAGCGADKHGCSPRRSSEALVQPAAQTEQERDTERLSSKLLIFSDTMSLLNFTKITFVWRVFILTWCSGRGGAHVSWSSDENKSLLHYLAEFWIVGTQLIISRVQRVKHFRPEICCIRTNHFGKR